MAGIYRNKLTGTPQAEVHPKYTGHALGINVPPQAVCKRVGEHPKVMDGMLLEACGFTRVEFGRLTRDPTKISKGFAK